MSNERLKSALAAVSQIKGGSVVGWWLEQQGQPIVEAAEELLALKENGQTVWWCEEHGFQATEYAVNHPDTRLRQCWGTAYGESDGPWDSEEDYTPCCIIKGLLHIHREGT